ncbi:unnamed protein product [Toxocara canis]|uniref:Tetraspanin n=1 Tax=Toxocara canis TaxID=6265 RepID=A0A183TUT3_TOXCA|nr:unnamed protein product [Toxocara canis]
MLRVQMRCGAHFQLYLALYIIASLGLVLFVLGFFGCCGAFCEQLCVIGLYFTVVAILFVVELAGAIYLLVNKENIKNSFINTFRTTIVGNYYKNQYIRQQLDLLQSEIGCAVKIVDIFENNIVIIIVVAAAIFIVEGQLDELATVNNSTSLDILVDYFKYSLDMGNFQYRDISGILTHAKKNSKIYVSKDPRKTVKNGRLEPQESYTDTTNPLPCGLCNQSCANGISGMADTSIERKVLTLECVRKSCDEEPPERLRWC